MQFSAPTSASHALAPSSMPMSMPMDAACAPMSNNSNDDDNTNSSMVRAQDERDAKRRKLVVTPQSDAADFGVGADDADADSDMMMDAPPSSDHQVVATSSSNNSNAMEMDGSNNNNNNVSKYAHPASSNQFNGNALTDEELVYQVLDSGAQSYAEVVQFCVKVGVPVSRILEMDLMRRLSYLRVG